MEEKQASLQDIVKNDYQEQTILNLNIPMMILKISY